ncbi:TPA: hypothetical protein DF272_06285 [Candidatus Falkowbacteria bacterium]|nr:hypothetical protein [Candidatus Falkowbacteria bacterium]
MLHRQYLGITIIAVLWLIIASCSHQQSESPNKNPNRKQIGVHKTTKDIQQHDAKSKKQLSEEKLQTVKALKAELAAKAQTLRGTVVKFESEIQRNVKEIQEEKSYTGQQGFDESIKNQRIRNCLEAIQKAHGYKQIVIEAAQKTEAGEIELVGVEKQLDLDIILLDSMEDAEIDRLLDRLDLVITQYQPRTQKLILPPPKEADLKELDEIYDQYIFAEEKKKVQEKLLKSKQEEELKQKKELEKQKRAELLEQRRQKSRRLRILEKKKAETQLHEIELAKQKQIEQERQRQIEFERLKQIEDEKRREAELERQRVAKEQFIRQLELAVLFIKVAAEKKRQEEEKAAASVAEWKAWKEENQKKYCFCPNIRCDYQTIISDVDFKGNCATEHCPTHALPLVPFKR